LLPLQHPQQRLQLVQLAAPLVLVAQTVQAVAQTSPTILHSKLFKHV
jgi:hypothetical protein